MSDVYKATIEAEIVLKPIVSSTRYVDSPEVTGPARAAMPLPQTAAPVNQGRVSDLTSRSAPWYSGGTASIVIILLVIACVLVGFNLYQNNRATIGSWWYGAPAPVAELSPPGGGKTDDRIGGGSSVAPQPAVALQPVARGNPTKEQYLKDCAAAGALVTQMPDGRLNCHRDATVTFERGTPIASLQNAKTVAQYKAACEAIRGAKYWMEENGRPHCNRPD